MLISLRAIRPYFPNLAADIDVVRARYECCLRSTGAFTYGAPSLSLGHAGEALALTWDNEAEFKNRVYCISSKVLESNRVWMRDAGRDDSWVGLYTGEAGRAWIWAIAKLGFTDEHGKFVLGGGLIGYTD